jgi:hypothetical protein
MGHSSEIRDFMVNDRGIKIMDADPLKKHSRRTAEKAEAFSGNGVKHKP